MKSRLAKEMFLEAWAKGVPVKDIMKALGVSRRTLVYWREGMGLPKRMPFGHQPKEAK